MPSGTRGRSWRLDRREWPALRAALALPPTWRPTKGSGFRGAKRRAVFEQPVGRTTCPEPPKNKRQTGSAKGG
eukprot:12293285-Heterocapsa_arctica.AAC.1